MTDMKLIDLFGELELGTFENDIMEKELDGPWKRIKNKCSDFVNCIKRNIKKIIAIASVIAACIACVAGMILLIGKQSKRSKAVA